VVGYCDESYPAFLAQNTVLSLTKLKATVVFRMLDGTA
jgi:hypothetical protein